MWFVDECGRVDVGTGSEAGGWGAVWTWSEAGSLDAGRGLESLMGSLGGGLWRVLDEPLCIGRSLVRCVSGGMFPIPDDVAAALFVFEFFQGISLVGVC